MNEQGEKLNRARILLSKLAAMQTDHLEQTDISRLQTLAQEYNILSNDPKIKDRFRRMEQNVSISPAIMRILEETKENPSNISNQEIIDENQNEQQQREEYQQIETDYERLSLQEIDGMTYEMYKKMMKAAPQAMFDRPDLLERYLAENPNRINETVRYKGKEMPLHEVRVQASADLIKEGKNLQKEISKEKQNLRTSANQYVAYLVQQGHSLDKVQQIAKKELGKDSPIAQEITSLSKEDLNQAASTALPPNAPKNKEEWQRKNNEHKQKNVILTGKRKIIAARIKNMERISKIIDKYGKGNSAVQASSKKANKNLNDLKNVLKNVDKEIKQKPKEKNISPQQKTQNDTSSSNTVEQTNQSADVTQTLSENSTRISQESQNQQNQNHLPANNGR